MKAVNLLKELEQVTEYWFPRIVGQVNNEFIKVAKLKGTLAWHKHDDEDEFFLVVKGQLAIEYEDRRVILNEGDFHVVSKGSMHNPVAEEECWIVLVETVTTKHTGDAVVSESRTIEEQLATSVRP